MGQDDVSRLKYPHPLDNRSFGIAAEKVTASTKPKLTISVVTRAPLHRHPSDLIRFKVHKYSLLETWAPIRD